MRPTINYEPGTHEEHIQRVLAIMNRDALATHRLCGGEMTDIPHVTPPHEMAARLLDERVTDRASKVERLCTENGRMLAELASLQQEVRKFRSEEPSVQVLSLSSELEQRSRELTALRASHKALLDAAKPVMSQLGECHVCHAQLWIQETPAHCVDCSSRCEDHEEPECTPMGDLCARLGDAIDAAEKIGEQR